MLSQGGTCSINPTTVRQQRNRRELWAALEHAFFPLTFPITVGLGRIAIAITLGAHLRHRSDPGWEHVFPRHFLAALIGLLLLCVLVMICYSNADRLVRLLSKSGTTILTRLSALILLAIGVQII